MDLQKDKERWSRVKDLLAEALQHPSSERKQFLDQACGSDAALRSEVESLLTYEQPQDQITAAGKFSDQFKPPEKIGPYRILRSLGQGGMGSVYLAERADEEYRKEVAIKLIRSDMTTEFVLHRFLNERQILASLDHPNIARLLEGGTTEDGLPYLVMEYVEGQPIPEYCDLNRLNTEMRLMLFRQLCDAVQYAHQRLVIHRDIKPGNILVTKAGVPKLLDFGIAKLLTPELAAQTLDATGTGMRLMTPEYASPEQVKGEPITTATDVYALGVVLYELLTGHSPYGQIGGALHEIAGAVCEVEPEKPSTAIRKAVEVRKEGIARLITAETVSSTREGEPNRLQRRLRGDLDNILLKALRKEPKERYSSVEQFSEDIRRHLDGLPVIARRATWMYRARKFTRRNRVAVTAAVLFLIALIGGILAVNQQRLRAERRFNDVRKLARAVVFDYHDQIADLPGSTPVRQKLVKDALQYLDSLAAEATQDRELQRELAAAYIKIGDVQGNSNMDNIGDITGALASYKKALALREAQNASYPADKGLQRELAESHTRIGDILSDTGELQPAHDSYERAMKLLEALSTGSSSDTVVQQQLAEIYFRIGDVKGNPFLPNLGNPTAALEFHRKALSLLERLPATPEVQASLVNSHRTLAGILLTVGDLEKSEQHARQGLRIAETLNQAETESVRAGKALANARESLGRVLMTKGKWDEALAVYKQILAADQAMAKADPKNVQAQRYVSGDYIQIGHILASQKKYAEALASHLEALAIDQIRSAQDPGNDLARYEVSLDHLSVADVLVPLKELQRALRHQQEAVAIQEELSRKDPNDFQAALNLALAKDRYSETLAMLEDHRKALEHLRQGLPAGEKALNQDSTNDRARRQLALRYFRIGNSAFALASDESLPADQRTEYWRESLQAYQRSLGFLQELQKKDALPREHADKLTLIPQKIIECEKALSQ
jgi:non-specific serine/threonine protein kinase/serine/threonine-protein kinase